MAQSSGAQIQLEESLAGLTLSQDEEDCVYRTVQEGITNAIRHGHATRPRCGAISRTACWKCR